MPTDAPIPPKSNDRADALAVLQRLRDSGHQAYFAGGCVRDLLLGREPKDWDVATDAPPGRVRELFTHTQAVGAAFGVILVRHRRSHVEVATFRSDGRYVDGRHPTGVTFTTAEEDARRRDFTINGLFLDPIEDRVIDFVGGQQDLSARLIRAIGEPERRFEEDHLRLLRAVRFAARLGFAIEPVTAAAIRGHAPQLARISPERIADELRNMMPPATRLAAWNLLHATNLAPIVFRFVDLPTGEPDDDRTADGVFRHLAPGEAVPFPLAMAAAVLQWRYWAGPATDTVHATLTKSAAARLTAALRKALRLSNDECDAIEQTLAGLEPLLKPQPPSVALLKRFLARPTAGFSRALLSAMQSAGVVDPARAADLATELARLEQTDYAPPPLITGDDLTAAGIRPGPVFKRMLDAAYDAQLEGRAATFAEALEVALSLR